MKRMLIWLVLGIMSIACFAEDIIITTDAKQLKVLITEVSSKEIKYKELDNLDGPIFVLPTDEINSIIFSNGQVKTYVHNNQSIVQSPNNSVSVNKTQSIEKTETHYVSRSGNKYYCDGRQLSSDEYSNFLKRNCSIAYENYSKGNVTSAAGWALFGSGLGIDLGTVIGAAIVGRSSTTLTALSIFSGILEIASIPTLAVGYAKMHKSVDIYNMQCAKNQSTAYWSINAHQDGISIAYNF